MLKEIDQIVNKHINEPAIIVGLGPSLNNYLDKLPIYLDNKYKIIAVNDWWNFYDKASYVLFASTVSTIYNFAPYLNRYKNPIIYADNVDLTPYEWIQNNILQDIDIYTYDQRHFQQKKCSQLMKEIPYYGGFDPTGVCCPRIKERKTIQELLQFVSKTETHYKTGDTCVLHAIAVGILMKCNPIYIIGMDLDYKYGYAKTKVPKFIHPSEMGELINYYFRILEDIDTLYLSAKNLGIKLINLNKDSTYKNIEIGELPKL